MNNTKLVEFDIYCATCKHYEVPETEEPCNECLTTPARFESHRPINYKEDEARIIALRNEDEGK